MPTLEEMKYRFDDTTQVAEWYALLTKNFPELFEKHDDYTLYHQSITGEEIEMEKERTIYSYPEGEIKLQRRLRGLKVMIFESDISGGYLVSYYNPLIDVLKPILKSLNLDHVDLNHISFQKPGEGVKLKTESSLASQNIPFDSTILIKIDLPPPPTIDNNTSSSLSVDGGEGSNDVCIWDEPDGDKYIREISSEDGEVKLVELGTINKLVERLTQTNKGTFFFFI